MSSNAPFEPDWASPPGDTIRQLMAAKGLDHTELSQLTGLDQMNIAGLLTGARSVTAQVALVLEKAFGSKSSYWIRRETQFSQQLTHFVDAVAAQPPDWLKSAPLSSMKKLGWVNDVGSTASAKLVALLRFFGVSNLDELLKQQASMFGSVAFKHTSTFESEMLPLAAWLRQAEIFANATPCAPWNKKALVERLPTLKVLTRIKSPELFLPRLRQLCAECGVAVAMVRTPSDCHVTAAARFLGPNKALIILSGRYRSDDHFWFALFHEVAHLILHSHTKLFLEDEKADETKCEVEANTFAAEQLIPSEELNRLRASRLTTETLIKSARRLGVSPGIVVGQLQHSGRLKPAQFSYLKRRYTWESLLS